MHIKNIIVNNGIKEYNSSEIKSDERILTLVKAGLIINGFTPNIVKKINAENGLIYIASNLNFTNGKCELKNVSTDLLLEWNQNKF